MERIVYLQGLDLLVTCESDRGASLWEAGGRMRMSARLPHGRSAMDATRIQGTQGGIKAHETRASLRRIASLPYVT